MDRHIKALEILKSGTVIPATPLALKADRTFDAEQQKILTGYYLAAGAGGVATAVHSTQFEIRDPEVNLFETVLETVSETIDAYEKKSGRVVVKVAGVCGPVEQAVREAELAKKYGYDAVLLSPGGLNHLSEDEMIARTEAVAKVMPVIGFYLQTAVGGRHFSYSYWARLCEIDGVVAIKSAPFNRYYTLDVVRACALSSRANEITLYTGNDDNIIVDLLTEYKFTVDGKTYSKRFEGGLLGHWSVWTHAVVEMFKKIKANPTLSPEYLQLAAEVTDANAVVFDTANDFAGCIPGLHEVLRRQGLMKGTWCLNPNEVLSPGQSEELDRIYAMYPHLTDDDFAKEYLASL